ncbi:Lrp/AsnC family leucine-responsive transcriptional regulator [Mycoplana sp. BE70]|uniref:Lrp/AsnC family transcriptional regulator n=1 Tax=Mycoplana sp. BE70 TaxID=2817775 RepID=UPI0028575F6C|nr:Lrp/AsnC family transcriptional regulator [Mycoplana sp. BE70]MDR6755145.1 Lrp/AsnC family leucine-responsive transcriptional regulator [Mycoplana sp. BE70]
MLDAFDAKLLNLMQTDTRRTAQELSEAVGLSPSACLRRLNRLRESRVIEAEIAVVSPAAVGHRLTMVVEVSLERERPDIMSDFKKMMRATPEVIQCYYVTGEVDFILIVAVKSMSDYETFTNDFLFNNKNIKRFNTLVVMDRVKVSLAVPIE